MATALRTRGLLLVFGVALLAAGCGGANDDELLVFAASSLTEAFDEIERAYEAANPDVDVVVSFAGSSALREQLLDGAPASVFATANHNDVFSIDDAGLLRGTSELFATNHLQVAVPAGNPGRVQSLADFADPALRIGLCAEPVPCGGAADFMLTLADVEPLPDTREPNVKSLAAKLVDGELDAGLVYSTDIEAAEGALEHIQVDPGLRSRPVVYAAMNVSNADTNPSAAAFIAFIMSAQAQQILIDHGFGGAR